MSTIPVPLLTPYFSKNPFIFPFPPTCIFFNCSSFHASIVTERTNDICTPRPRCFPEHSRHMKQPYDTDAHCGFFDEQSQQTLLSGRDCSSRRIFNDSGDAWRHGKRSAGKVTSAVRRRSIETWPSVGRLSRHADTGLGTRDSNSNTSQSRIRKRTMLHAIQKDQCRVSSEIEFG